MGPIHTNRHIVLAFTGHRTGMAANAHSIIDDKSVIHIKIGLLECCLPAGQAGIFGLM